jgi:hypothetical protein
MKESRYGGALRLLHVAFVLPAVAGPTGAPQAKAVHSLAVIAEYAMPMKAAADVRWADDGSVLIADQKQGVGQVTLPASGEATVSWLPEWPPPTGPDTQVKHLALYGNRIAAAGMAFMLRWHERQGSASGQMAMYYIIDLDLNGDRLLVSGLRRDAAGKLGGTARWRGLAP